MQPGDASQAAPTPVLIVGAGPAGLSLAIELGAQGVPCTLIEQGDGTVDFPTANLLNARTLEHFRRWGIADELRYHGFPPDYPRTCLFLTRLNGYELARFELPGNGDPRARSPYSPEGRLWCPKFYFFPVLLRRAQADPRVTVRLGCRLDSFRQDADGVTAEVVDVANGRREKIDARYLVACDGGSSEVRRQLDIPMRGVFAEGHNASIYFQTDLLRHHRHGPAIQYRIHNARFTGGIFAMDGRDHWRVNVRLGPREVAAFDPARCLRDALGDGVPFTLLADKPWSGHRVVAERYRAGRVFLAGDAAHLLWPLGGFGMNTAIGDAVDLAWKLAAVVQGWGGAALLDSYEAERRPIGVRNVEEAASIKAADAQIPISPLMEEDSPAGARLRAEAARLIEATRREEFAVESPGIDLGYRYDDSPIYVPDGTPPPPYDTDTYVPTTRPGARAPHVWLRDGRSTLDLLGGGFTLLRLGPAAPTTTALEAAAAARGVPLRVLSLDEPDVVAAYERPLVLVRPDGHVAWRGDAPPPDAACLIDVVRGTAGAGEEAS
ncbi:MAG TPA: FAD-dependent monooxygenase [Chloroflexota bacterium]|nr:FAD-dependent monooxygenase [Chloroflexota bacterium]